MCVCVREGLECRWICAAFAFSIFYSTVFYMYFLNILMVYFFRLAVHKSCPSALHTCVNIAPCTLLCGV